MRYFFFIFILGLFFPLVSFAATTQPGFVSLTDIPIFNNISGAVDISTVLNGIYGLCIGLSAALAVGMIMWGGLIYMGGDSITEKKVAREKITHAILGLLLVLSPAIVFGIIDKRILSLNIDTTPLTSTGTTGAGVTASDVQSTVWESTASNAAALCTEQGGTVTDLGGGTIRCTKSASTCLVYPAGTTAITADAQSCCSGQSGCTLNVGTRSQYSCTCSGTTTTGSSESTTTVSTTSSSGSCTPTNSSGCTYSGEDVGDTTCQNYKEGSAIPAKGDPNYGIASTCCNNVPNKTCTVLTPLGGGTSTCGCR